jgi:hypothetical protein
MIAPIDDRRHHEAQWEQWYWQASSDTSEVAVSLEWFSDHIEYRSWLRRSGEPLLRVIDLNVPLPRVGMELRTTGLWADHTCEVPLQQWTVTNECFADALDHPDDLVGTPTPYAVDLEWYATDVAALDLLPNLMGDSVAIAAGHDDTRPGGYTQTGVAHGVVELGGASSLAIEEWTAVRWHRWRVTPAVP